MIIRPQGLQTHGDFVMQKRIFIIFTIAFLFLTGCLSPKIKLFSDSTEPLREFVLEGRGKGKVLVISVKGFISDTSEKGFLSSNPSMVEKLVSQLVKAEKDKKIRAILLKIDSPGGTATASDLLYHELMEFKERTGVKILVSMMDLATSGGYYISLPADFILAHPTTITGSVGVVFIRPKVRGLMEKIGLDVEVSKSGKNKDMGSPFRETAEDEQKIFQNIIQNFSRRFLSLVEKHRRLAPDVLTEISSACVYTASDARDIGLVDDIAYLSQAIAKAKSMSGLPEDAKVVVYRRTEYPEDNLYNTSGMKSDSGKLSLINLKLPGTVPFLQTGFYYLWMPWSGGYGF